MTARPVSLQVDHQLRAAYVSLSDQPVAQTVEVNEDVLVDLDSLGLVVGVEMLDDSAPIPFNILVERFHVHSDVVGFLRAIRPDATTFILNATQSVEGATSAREAPSLAPV